MQDIKIYKQEDLVLKLNKYYNPQNLNLEEWELFLDILCGERDYQKEAIKNAIIFMAGGEYKSIDDLVTENYEQNVDIQSKYSRLNDYIRKIQIRNKFHANIDLATGERVIIVTGCTNAFISRVSGALIKNNLCIA